MSNIYVETAETLKKVMEVGFDFTQALRIHRLVDSQAETVVKSNKVIADKYEGMEFISELFNLGVGETRGIDAYNRYVLWAVENDEGVMNQTEFGIKLSMVAEKKRTNKGIVYSMEVIE